MTSRPGPWFVAFLWLVGAATALVLARAPVLLPIPLPFLFVPLGVGLVLEIAFRASSRFGSHPVSPGERALGVIGGAIIAVAGSALAAPG